MRSIEMLRSSWARSGRAEANDKTAIARLQVKKDSACSAKLELLNLRDFMNNLLDLIPACLAEFLPVLAVKPRRSARGYKAAFFFLRLVLPLTQDQGVHRTCRYPFPPMNLHLAYSGDGRITQSGRYITWSAGKT
ncbi:MAG: hypothetical protein DMG55_12400 [Acidobacteria bacterium]|nr:MAG: hypothetical protein DMG55_12400 [Acidobacteriota bacterium]